MSRIGTFGEKCFLVYLHPKRTEQKFLNPQTATVDEWKPSRVERKSSTHDCCILIVLAAGNKFRKKVNGRIILVSDNLINASTVDVQMGALQFIPQLLDEGLVTSLVFGPVRFCRFGTRSIVLVGQQFGT